MPRPSAASAPPITMANSSPLRRATRLVRIDQRAEPVGDGAEQLVAAGVAERVVDLLELVEVEHQQRDLAPGRPRFGETCRQMLVQRVAVGEAGQRVVLGQILYSFGLALAVGNVAHHRAILQPLDALPYREAGLERKRLAVLPPSLKLHDLAARHVKRLERQVQDRERHAGARAIADAQIRSSGWPIISFGS